MWRYHGRYEPDPYHPRGRGTCDRCQFQYLLDDLKYQYEYRGNSLTNIQIRVCSTCMDKPYEGRRPIRLPADPVPLRDPRVEPLSAEQNANGLPPSNLPQPIFVPD